MLNENGYRTGNTHLKKKIDERKGKRGEYFGLKS